MRSFLIVSSKNAVCDIGFSYQIKKDDILFCVQNRQMLRESKNFILIFEGYFYNKDISLIKLLEEERFETFKSIEGNFSLVVFDKKEKKIICVTDIANSKPLYYTLTHEVFAISNRLENIFSANLLKKEIDNDSLASYFKFGFILQPHTIYKNCKKIESASLLRYDPKTNAVKTQKYWSISECYNHPKSKEQEERITTNAKELLVKSIKKRVPQNNKAGAFLSGGYDSSTLCALLKKELDIDVETFTIGFEEKSINEAVFAKKVASYLGLKHTEYYFKDNDAKEIIMSLSDIFEQPFSDFGATPTIMLAKIAKKAGIDTLFGGDGGDQIFATADDLERIKKFMSTPFWIKEPLFHILDNLPLSLLKDIKYYNPFMTRYEKFLSLLKAEDIAGIIKTKTTLFTDNALSQLLSLPYDENEEFKNIRFGKYAQTLDKITGIYFKTFLMDAEIVKSSTALDFNDISLRNPYIDKDLIAYMTTIPQNLKIKNKIRKNILKNITHSYIPKELLDRSKMGFSIPFEKWLKFQLLDLLEDATDSDYIKNAGILNHKEVENIKKRFLKGDDRYKYKLWSIFIFQLWHKRNFA